MLTGTKKSLEVDPLTELEPRPNTAKVGGVFMDDDKLVPGCGGGNPVDGRSSITCSRGDGGGAWGGGNVIGGGRGAIGRSRNWSGSGLLATRALLRVRDLVVRNFTSLISLLAIGIRYKKGIGIGKEIVSLALYMTSHIDVRFWRSLDNFL